MQIQTIPKKSLLSQFLNSNRKDNLTFYTPEASMIYNIIYQFKDLYPASFSPIILNSILDSVQNNEKSLDELKNGIFFYSHKGNIKQNIAQMTLFTLGYSVFSFIHWNEKSYEKLKTFFRDKKPRELSLSELQDTIQDFFMDDLVNPRLRINDEALNFLNCEIAINILTILEQYFDIHQLLKKDIEGYFINDSCLVNDGQYKTIKISALSYLAQNSYSSYFNLSFYDKNISNIEDPLSLIVFEPKKYFSISSLATQIKSFTILDKQSYLKIMNTYLSELEVNIREINPETLSQIIYHEDFFTMINNSNLSQHEINSIIIKITNINPKLSVPDLFSKGSTAATVFHLLGDIPEIEAQQTLDRYFENSYYKSKQEFIEKNLVKGDTSKYFNNKFSKHSRIINQLLSFPVLKSWVESTGESFDPDLKLFQFTLHVADEPTILNYLSIANSSNIDILMDKIEKFYPSNTKIKVNAPNGIKYEIFSIERIQNLLMHQDIKKSSPKKSKPLKF